MEVSARSSSEAQGYKDLYLTLGGGGLAVTFVRVMMKEARKSKEKMKAKVQQGGLWCETTETQKNPTAAGKPKKQRNEEDAEENLKCGSLNSLKQLSIRKIRDKEQSMEKNHTFDY